MGAVQLSKHLGEKILEVKVVGDVWHKPLVVLLVTSPVDSVDLWIVELLVHLLPDVAEDVVPLGLRLELIVSRERDCARRSAGDRDLRDRASCENIEILVVG